MTDWKQHQFEPYKMPWLQGHESNCKCSHCAQMDLFIDALVVLLFLLEELSEQHHSDHRMAEWIIGRLSPEELEERKKSGRY